MLVEIFKEKKSHIPLKRKKYNYQKPGFCIIAGSPHLTCAVGMPFFTVELLMHFEAF